MVGRMNANGPGVPLLGQQQVAQEASAQQVALSIYIPLIPHLALFRLEQGYPSAGGLDQEDATPERIAEEAKEIVDAALAKIGIVVREGQG